jgi:hypothetical protein
LGAKALAQSTDSVSEITRGHPLSPLRLLSSRGLTVNSYTALWEDNSRPLCFGRVCHAEGDAFSQLDFVTPTRESSPDDITCLLEAVIRVSGAWGARYLLAELPENSDYLPAFRRADFVVWSQARVYRFRGDFVAAGAAENLWRQWTDQDVKAMQALHRCAVPRLFQAVEPVSRKLAQGLAAADEQGRLLGFADLAYGPNGIWLQPLFDPGADHISLLQQLVQAVPNRMGRPVYVCARSFQPQLFDALESLAFSMEQELARMVRHLTLQDKVPAPGRQQVYEGEKSEGSVPVIQSQQKGVR